MQASCNLDSSIEELAQIVDSDIVSDFHIGNSCFFVIAIDEFLETEDSSLLHNKIIDHNSFAILGYFRVSNRLYAIASRSSILEEGGSSFSTLLTQRELQVASFVALGWSNKQVASQLHISEWTVSAHLRRIFIKLNVDSRAAMVYKCASLISKSHESQYVAK